MRRRDIGANMHRSLGLAGIVVLILGCLVLAGRSAAADLPAIRVGALKYGTVNWELRVIADGLDRKHGFLLKPVVLADRDATSVALLSGDVDMIVTDWIWVAKQRQLGRRYAFVPFSVAVGAVMADPATGIRSLADLRGRSLGVAGGATDKSWVLLQAYARKTADLDLAQAASVQFAAPPLLNELVLRRRLDAVLNFWQFNARLAGKGLVPVVKIGDILPSLGLKSPPPLLGWVFDETWAEQPPGLARRLLDASYEAKRKMKSDDGLWRDLRPLMEAENDREFQILRDSYRDGIPERYTSADIAAAEAAFLLMRETNPQAVAGLTALPEGTFWRGYLP